MKSKALENLGKIINRSMSDIAFSDRDILDIDKNFHVFYKVPKSSKLPIITQTLALTDSIAKMRKDLIDFRRRNFIRNVFSSIEATIWCMKNILLEKKEILKSSDIIKLQEYKLVGPNKKNLELILYKIGLEESIKLTIKRFDEIILNKKNTNIFDNKNWENFKIALKIRHRITHPKSNIDLRVSKGETDLVRACYFWFFDDLIFKRIKKS